MKSEQKLKTNWLEVNFGRYKTTGNPDEFIVSCPRCRGFHRTFKLYINLEKRVFFCFRCGYKGTLDRLCYEDNLTSFFPDDKIEAKSISLDVLQDFVDKVAFREQKENEKEIHSIKNLLPGKPLLQYQDNSLAKAAISYCNQRGLNRTLINNYRVYYDPINLSLSTRIIFPWYEKDKLVFWIARSFLPDCQLSPDYLYPSSEDFPEGRKHLLYGIDDLEEQSTIQICEGVFDKIALGRNAVALGGKTMNSTQIYKLLAKKPNKIEIWLDSDAYLAGMKIRLQILRTGFSTVEVIKLPTGYDPAGLYLAPISDDSL